MKQNKGSYDINSKEIKIKQYEIMAVIEGETKIEKYWYEPNSGNTYDYEMKYVMGKVKKKDGHPNKKNMNTYII